MKPPTERWAPVPFRASEPPECRVLMRDGEWLVPPEKRPALPPAPADEDRRLWKLRKPSVGSAGGVSYGTRGERR